MSDGCRSADMTILFNDELSMVVKEGNLDPKFLVSLCLWVWVVGMHGVPVCMCVCPCMCMPVHLCMFVCYSIQTNACIPIYIHYTLCYSSFFW